MLFAPLYGTASFGSNEASYNEDEYPTCKSPHNHLLQPCTPHFPFSQPHYPHQSVYYIQTGQLLDLSETEVILYEDSCEMCNGGWPQNAYEYVAEKGGLLQRDVMKYDGDFLMVLSLVNSGELDEMTGGAGRGLFGVAVCVG